MTILSPRNFGRVFLNFRGDQLRYGLVSHLIDAFERNGILFFIDKDEQRGKDLTNLLVRIKESKIALVIFSSRYAESSWCMDELVKMKKRADKGKLEVIPIFYKVRARDVRRQTGKFGDKFWELAKVSSGDQIKKWKEALECISNKMGLSLRDKSSQADFIKEIVKEVERVLTAMGREDAEEHHRTSFIQNKRIKIHNFVPEYDEKSLENAHMNFSNARGEEEQNQEVLIVGVGFHPFEINDSDDEAYRKDPSRSTATSPKNISSHRAEPSRGETRTFPVWAEVDSRHVASPLRK